MSSVGIMEGAYFVGRAEILNWINTLLDTNYTKIEQCASGAPHCQIMHALAPDAVALHRVNFSARNEHEFVNNYKVLQAAFKKLEIDKHVDVPKLIKAKYQDNLEFLQWIKCYFDRHFTGAYYNAAEERNNAIATYNQGRSSATRQPLWTTGPQPGGGAVSKTERPPLRSSPAATQRPAAGRVRAATVADNKENSPAANQNGGRKTAARATNKAEPSVAVSAPELEAAKEKAALLEQTLEALEKERDFYFGKLRDIEILCQTHENQDDSFLLNVQKVLYATEGADDLAVAASDSDAVAQEDSQESKKKDCDFGISDDILTEINNKGALGELRVDIRV